MAYEYSSAEGTLRLTRSKGRWILQYAGRRAGQWPSLEVAVQAIARHQSGLPAWDRRDADASDDLLDWRPLGDSL
ncbi:MAG: hypothetical protein WDN25_30715 [Acetobacteraceae bacterium]